MANTSDSATGALDSILAHYGVKGMQWGVRNKTRNRPDKHADKTLYKSTAKRLTNAELEKRIKRMETEKKYNDLNKRTVKTGEKVTLEVMTSIGRTSIVAIGTGLGVYAGKKIVERKLGPDAANMIKTKK